MRGFVKKYTKAKHINKTQLSSTMQHTVEDPIIDHIKEKRQSETLAQANPNFLNLKINSKLMAMPNFRKLSTFNQRRSTEVASNDVQDRRAPNR